jgi:tetratricopeptide (TPR) repeat protein
MKNLDHLFGVSVNNAARLEEAEVHSVADLAAVQDLDNLSTRTGISVDLIREWHRTAQVEVHAARFRRRIGITLSAVIAVVAISIAYHVVRQRHSATTLTYLKASALYDQRKYDEAARVLDQAFARKENTAELHNLRGMLYQRSRETTEAMAEFQKALDLDRTYADAWNNLARTHQFLRQPQPAAQEYQKAIDLQPGVALYHRSFADYWESLNSADKAETEFKAAIQAQPSEIDSYLDLSNLYQREQKPDAAEAVLVRAITQNPNSDQAFAALASFYFDSKRYAEGTKAYYRAAELDPAARYLEDAARALRDGHQWDDALRTYQKILEKTPNDWEAHFRSGWILVNHKGASSAPQAISQLQAAIASTPGEEHNKWSYLNLAVAYYFEQQNTEADKALTEALRLDPTFGSAFIERGIFQQNRGLYKEAESSYLQAIQVDPQNTIAYSNLWWLYMDQYQLQLANQLFRKLEAIAPDDENTQLILARRLEGEERYTDAIKIYSKLHDQNPEDDYVIAALAQSEIQAGLQAHNKRLTVQGVDRLRQAVEKRPNVTTCFALAWAYHIIPEVRNLDEAERLYQETLSYDPGQTTAIHNLQAIALAKGNMQLVVQLARKSLNRNPEDSDSMENLGYALFLQGNLNGAIDQYKQAIERVGDDPIVHTAYAEALLWRGDATQAHEELARARDTLLREGDMSQGTWIWMIEAQDGSEERRRMVYYRTLAEKRAVVELFDALTYLRENNVASALKGYRAATQLLTASAADDKEIVHKAISDLYRLRKVSFPQPAAELGLAYLYDWVGDRELAVRHWKLYLESGTDPVGIEEAHRGLAASLSRTDSAASPATAC